MQTCKLWIEKKKRKWPITFVFQFSSTVIWKGEEISRSYVHFPVCIVNMAVCSCTKCMCTLITGNYHRSWSKETTKLQDSKTTYCLLPPGHKTGQHFLPGCLSGLQKTLKNPLPGVPYDSILTHWSFQLCTCNVPPDALSCHIKKSIWTHKAPTLSPPYLPWRRL